MTKTLRECRHIKRQIGDAHYTAGNVRLLELIEGDNGYRMLVERVLSRKVPSKGVLGFIGFEDDQTEIKTECWFSQHGSQWYLVPCGTSAERVSYYLNTHLRTLFQEEYAHKRMFQEAS